eukprot:m.612023 g.612023  ORF g.612023 m.612023 type:complete len:62 (-) comp22500_c0_seq59:1872-2057(-)
MQFCWRAGENTALPIHHEDCPDKLTRKLLTQRMLTSGKTIHPPISEPNIRNPDVVGAKVYQ